MNDRHLLIVTLSLEEIRLALGLPEAVRVVDVRYDPISSNGVDVLLEGEDLPVCRFGFMPMHAQRRRVESQRNQLALEAAPPPAGGWTYGAASDA